MAARVQLVLLVALVALLVGVVPAVAAPPPRPVCGACGGAFAETAAYHGVSLTVEYSTATVRIHENGSATWLVRNSVNEAAAERLRANTTLLSHIAADASDGTLLGVHITPGGVVTLRYRTAGFATSSVGGVVLTDYFTGFAYRNYVGLGADRLTVVAPVGMHVGRAVPGATVEASRMTLTSYDAGTDSAFITFVPRGSYLGLVWSILAVAVALAPVIALNLLVFVALPSAAFAAFVGLAVGVLSRAGDGFGRVERYGGLAIATVGLFLTASPVYTDLPAVFGVVPPLFAVGVGLAVFGTVLSTRIVRDRATYRTLVVGTVLATLVTAGVAVVAGDGMQWSLSVLVGLPAFALIPAGYAVGRSERRRSIATAVVGFAVALALWIPHIWLNGGVLLAIIGVMYAVVLTLIGWPLLVIGASLASPERRTQVD